MKNKLQRYTYSVQKFR